VVVVVVAGAAAEGLSDTTSVVGNPAALGFAGVVVVVDVVDVLLDVVVVDGGATVVVVAGSGGTHSIVTSAPTEATFPEPKARSRVTVVPAIMVMTPVETSSVCRSIGSTNSSPAMFRMSVLSWIDRWWVFLDERTKAHSCPATWDVSACPSRTVEYGSPRVMVSVGTVMIATGDDANAPAEMMNTATTTIAARADLTYLARVQTGSTVPTMGKSFPDIL
jgi:hypothetical protein